MIKQCLDKHKFVQDCGVVKSIAHLVILVTGTVPFLFAFRKQALDYGQAFLWK